jgi:transposase
MPYSPELIARIRRLHFYEHYTIHAVAQVVGFHRDTVKRILYGDGSPNSSHRRIQIVDQFLPVIEEHLNQYPSIRSTALIRILRERGYKGSYSSLLRAVRPIRKKVKRTFRPMQVFQGEQGQVDWAHFGNLDVRGGERKVYLFVMVLSWSRALFAKFTFDQKTDSFLRLHEEAFTYFGGNPRHILYDNLKSAVLERYQDKIRFNPQLVEFSGCYGYQPRACRPFAGNQKGRVERAIRYIRDNFFSGYSMTDIEKANEDIRTWLDTEANNRQWPDNKQRNIGEVWEEEKQFLISPIEKKISPRLSSNLRSNKCSLVRFDLNDYSIPWEYTREIVTAEADDFTVVFYHQGKKIAEHNRSWSRGERITKDEHWQDKERQGLHNADSLLLRFPDLDEIYRTLVDRGESLRTLKRHMQEIRNLYGDRLFQQALRIAKKRTMYHPSQITRIIVGLEKANSHTPRSAVQLNRKELAEMEIRSHELETYDNL